jgi:hypothetical protein
MEQAKLAVLAQVVDGMEEQADLVIKVDLLHQKETMEVVFQEVTCKAAEAAELDRLEGLGFQELKQEAQVDLVLVAALLVLVLHVQAVVAEEAALQVEQLVQVVAEQGQVMEELDLVELLTREVAAAEVTVNMQLEEQADLV